MYKSKPSDFACLKISIPGGKDAMAVQFPLFGLPSLKVVGQTCRKTHCRVWRDAPSIRCLLHKHEAPLQLSSTHVKTWAWHHVPISVLGGYRCEHLDSHLVYPNQWTLVQAENLSQGVKRSIIEKDTQGWTLASTFTHRCWGCFNENVPYRP